jgi:putative transposase
VPKTAGHDEPFYPQSLERGRRSTRAVMLAVAEMYVKGVSTRDAEAVMKEFGIESLSSSQVTLPEHHRRRLRTSNRKHPVKAALPV